MSEKVFVYGTLKRGFPNNDFMEFVAKGKFLSDKLSPPVFDLKSWGGVLPVLVQGDWSIRGEVYEVSPEGMEWLDHLEGNGSMYQRKKYEDIWVYEMADSVRPFASLDDAGVFEWADPPSKVWVGFNGD